MTASNSTSALWLGPVCYGDSMQIQENHTEALRGTKDIVVLGMEYNKVITAGLQISADEVLEIQKRLPEYNVISTRRGGKLTLHDQGQLVIYPLMDLREWGLGVKDYVCVCLKTTARLLKAYDQLAKPDMDRAGVYTPKGKIAFCGIRVENGVTNHGLSINVANTLNNFKVIVPCGEPGLSMDRIGEGRSLEQIFQNWTFEFFNALRLNQTIN